MSHEAGAFRVYGRTILNSGSNKLRQGNRMDKSGRAIAWIQFVDVTGSDFYRAGGATVASPALQRGEGGRQKSAPLGPA